MLCLRCTAIQFRESPLDLLGRRSWIDEMHVLHRSPESLRSSEDQGCRLCRLISTQLGSREVESEECESLNAFIALKIRWSRDLNDLRSVGIVSRLGNAQLDVIEDITDQYRKVLEKHASQGLQPALGALGHQSTSHKADQTRDSPVYSGQLHPSDTTFNWALAWNWKENCLRTHETCRGRAHSQIPQLPTRLLCVDDLDCLRIQNTDKNTKGPYLALSYCWGEGKRFRTLKDNVKDHEVNIALDELPKTFKDAVEVAHKLKYRYVWIDALCIIQDDNDDLEKEMAKMGDVYRYADFTIFAEGASSSHAGLLPSRDNSRYYPCKMPVQIKRNGQVETRAFTVAGVCNGPDYLMGRGWVLQEEVLTSRFLIFGQQMRWKCMLTQASETRPVPSRSDDVVRIIDPSKLSRLRTCLYGVDEELSSVDNYGGASLDPFDAWYKMVEQYSDRELSFQSDVLRALGGLAAMFAQRHSATYLAGLWKESLEPGLCWYVSTNDHREGFDESVREKVPSWSWASSGKVRIRFYRTSSLLIAKGETHEADAPSHKAATVEKAPDIAQLECQRAFCDSIDTINHVEGANVQGQQITARWGLQLRSLLRKGVVRYSAAYSVWRTEFSYSGARAASSTYQESTHSFSATPRVHPRYPALLLDSMTGQAVGEVALDRLLEKRAMGASGAGSEQDTDEEVWCLHVARWTPSKGRQGYGKDTQSTCLILQRSQADNSVYSRLGLGFIHDEDWFRCPATGSTGLGDPNRNYAVATLADCHVI